MKTLPRVIEAGAAGSPAVVSDIPAHRSLITDAALRFAPDDAVRLQGILEAVVSEPALRAVIVAAQAPVWRGFTRAAVGAKIWHASALARPALVRGAKPRIVMLTPLPPEQSWVAEYSAATARAMAPFAELTLISGQRISAQTHLNTKFDRVVSVIGNAPLHAEIYALALKWGSAVICHETRLLGLHASAGLAHAASVAARELGREVSAEEIVAWAEDESQREASFLHELAAVARPLIFHSRDSVERVQARFGAKPRFLPFAIYRAFPGQVTRDAKAQARRVLGLAPEQKLIASFGFSGRGKGIEILLRAMAKLRAERDCRLVFVGAGTVHTAAFRALAGLLGIADSVRFSEKFVVEADYRNYLLAADGAVQLREGGPGNISGALQDCIAAGLPAVANADLANNLAAPAYVKRVSDQLDADEIAAALGEILEGGFNTEQERRAYCDAHDMAGYAKNLLEILEVGF